MPMQLDAREQPASRCKMQLDARGTASRCRILAVTALSQAPGGDWTHTKSCKNCLQASNVVVCVIVDEFLQYSVHFLALFKESACG